MTTFAVVKNKDNNETEYFSFDRIHSNAPDVGFVCNSLWLLNGFYVIFLINP